MKEETRQNIVAIVAVIGVSAAVVAVWQTGEQLRQTKRQLNIAQEQVAVPQLVEAIKLLERDSSLSQKSAVKMLENLAINNQKYTQQSIDVLLSVTSKFMKNNKCKKPTKVVNGVLKSISNILKSNKHQLLDLSNAWLCGLKLIDNDSTINIYANLHNAKLRYSEFENVDFSYANLNNADFRNATLTNIDFSDGNKQGKELNNRLAGIKFFSTKLTDTGKTREVWVNPSFVQCKSYSNTGSCATGDPPEGHYKTEPIKGKQSIDIAVFKGSVDFTGTKKYNIDFGCDLFKNTLEIKNLKQLCNQ